MDLKRTSTIDNAHSNICCYIVDYPINSLIHLDQTFHDPFFYLVSKAYPASLKY